MYIMSECDLSEIKCILAEMISKEDEIYYPDGNLSDLREIFGIIKDLRYISTEDYLEFNKLRKTEDDKE